MKNEEKKKGLQKTPKLGFNVIIYTKRASSYNQSSSYLESHIIISIFKIFVAQNGEVLGVGIAANI